MQMVMAVDTPIQAVEQVVKYLEYRSKQHETAAANVTSKKDQMKWIAAAAALLSAANDLRKVAIVAATDTTT
jgi:precorrin-3B methylase